MSSEIPLLRSTRPPARKVHLAVRWTSPTQIVGKCGIVFDAPQVVEWDGSVAEVTCRGCQRRIHALHAEEGAQDE